MSDFQLRTATPQDAERLSHIGVATFVDSYTYDIDGDAMMGHCTIQHSKSVYEAYLADPNTRTWLAEYTPTGAPVGYALVCPPDLPVALLEGDVELKRIYLLSRFHGHGIGKALMDASIAHAKALNAPRLLLGTYEDNQLAMRFYHRAGFHTIGTRQFQVGNRMYDDIVMALTLN